MSNYNDNSNKETVIVYRDGERIISPDGITIPFEEYKELIIIKGKYEELKSQQTNQPKVIYRDILTGDSLPQPEYKVIC